MDGKTCVNDENVINVDCGTEFKMTNYRNVFQNYVSYVQRIQTISYMFVPNEEPNVSSFSVSRIS